MTFYLVNVLLTIMTSVSEATVDRRASRHSGTKIKIRGKKKM